MRQIRPLPAHVISRLRSSTILSDVAQIAEELVCNSIDAGATQIQVQVDAEAYHLKVDDNGCGIIRDDLTIVGDRHATSKLHDLDEIEQGPKTLGFRGEALSSLSDIALVEITSRYRGTPNTYRKILKDCATISIGLCGEQRAYGTTVIVKDIFYNQPVRRRLLYSSHKKIVQSVKERIMRLVLIHPQVSFIVKDLARQEELLHSKCAASMRSTLCHVYGEKLFSNLQETDFAQGHFRLSGFLSKSYHCLPSKAVQFFYINRRYVHKTPIHKLINTWARSCKNSDRTKVVDFKQSKRQERKKAGKEDPSQEKQLFPVFVLNMICPLSEYDITFEPSKTLVEFKDWIPVISFVKCILRSIWRDITNLQNEGGVQALGLVYEDSTKPSSSSANRHQQKDIPPMAVRRALVQGGKLDCCSADQDHDCKQSSAICFDHASKQLGPSLRATALPIQGVSGRKQTVQVPSSDILLKAQQIRKSSKKLKIEIPDDSDDRTLDKRPWPMLSCQQGRTRKKAKGSPRNLDELFPNVQGREWPDSDHLVNSRLQPSSDDLFSLPYSNSGRSLSPAANDICINDPDFDMVLLPCTRSSPVSSDNDFTESPNFDLNQNLTHRIESRFSFLEEDTEGETVANILDLEDYNVRASMWSGSDDSLDLNYPDSPDLFPEVGKSSPDVCIGQEKCERNPHQSDSDQSGLNINWKSKTPHQRHDQKYVDDEYEELESCLYSGRRSTHASWEREPPESSQLKCESFREFTPEDIENSEPQAHSVTTVKIVDIICKDRLPLHVEKQDEFDDIAPYPLGPRIRLDTFFPDHPGGQIYGIDEYGEQKTCRDYVDPCVYTSRLYVSKRSQSGPPFYKPPERCGKHVNPPSSTSTAKLLVDFGQDGAARRIKPVSFMTLRTGDTLDASRNVLLASDESFLAPGTTSDSPYNPLCTSDGPDRNVGAMDEEIHTSDAADNCSMQYQEATPGKGRSQEVNTLDEETDLANDSVQVMLKGWSNPCMKKYEDILDLSSGILCSNSNSLLPDSIVKESLKHARVFQQVNKKFIPAVADSILLLIDQHAADERVRLEELREEVLGSSTMKQTSLLKSTQELTLEFMEQQMLQTYSQQIEDWGWRLKTPSGKSSTYVSAGGMCKVLLCAVPRILGVNLTGADLTEYLRQLTDTQGSSAPPPAIIRILNNKACRGAIMFGDTLLPAECRQLVEQLKATSLCFQCAHGRPTMVPLVDLQALRKRLQSSSGFGNESGKACGSTASKIGKYSSKWHGLQTRVRPTIARAQARLKQAL